MSTTYKWVDRYSPTKLQELILNPSTKTMLEEFIKRRKLPHILMVGKPGIGKDSTANILINELNADKLYIDCTKSNIDTIKTKVAGYCEAVAFDNEYRIVFLREVHRLSFEAQNSLLNLIEDNQQYSISFILTANYLAKVIPAVQSRCQQLDIKTEKKEILNRCISILKKEEVEYTKNEVKEFLEEVIKVKYPDIRSIISTLEMWSVSGTLTNYGLSSAEDIEKVCKYIINWKGNPKDLRVYLIQNEGLFNSDWELLLGAVFNQLEDPSLQIKCAEKLYQMSLVLDKEIQFYSFILILNQQ